MTEKFEATHRLKGSGYELRKEYLDGTTYVDAHGNRVSVPGGAVEKVTLPEPDDGTLWRRDATGEDYFYCNATEKFFPLKCSENVVPVDRYTEKQEKFTRMYPYGYGYPAGKMLQDCLDNFGASHIPKVTMHWDYGKVVVSLETRHPDRTWKGTGDTVEKAVQDLNLKMIE